VTPFFCQSKVRNMSNKTPKLPRRVGDKVKVCGDFAGRLYNVPEGRGEVTAIEYPRAEVKFNNTTLECSVYLLELVDSNGVVQY